MCNHVFQGRMESICNHGCHWLLLEVESAHTSTRAAVRSIQCCCHLSVKLILSILNFVFETFMRVLTGHAHGVWKDSIINDRSTQILLKTDERYKRHYCCQTSKSMSNFYSRKKPLENLTMLYMICLMSLLFCQMK